jgi:hypothetical protein
MLFLSMGLCNFIIFWVHGSQLRFNGFLCGSPYKQKLPESVSKRELAYYRLTDGLLAK